jgi:hypothetical protein
MMSVSILDAAQRVDLTKSAMNFNRYIRIESRRVGVIGEQVDKYAQTRPKGLPRSG